jgi:hypothetical protein
MGLHVVLFRAVTSMGRSPQARIARAAKPAAKNLPRSQAFMFGALYELKIQKEISAEVIPVPCCS